MRLSGAASSSLRSALGGPARPANWLGATPVALYLQISEPPWVLALLAHDAVRLPCAMVLPTTSAELSLESLSPVAATPVVGTPVVGTPMAGPPVVGDGSLAWTGAAGPVVVRAAREWAPAMVGRGLVVPTALATLQVALTSPAALGTLRAALTWPAVLGIDGELVPMLTADPAAAVARLLGRGPGLTPAGDDVLAGFLVGAYAFGLDAAEVRAATLALASARTSALSAALLWHAARGECVDELAAVTAHLIGVGSQPQAAISRLLAVGHTSGAALAVGLAAAAAAANVYAARPTVGRPV